MVSHRYSSGFRRKYAAQVRVRRRGLQSTAVRKNDATTNTNGSSANEQTRAAATFLYKEKTKVGNIWPMCRFRKVLLDIHCNCFLLNFVNDSCDIVCVRRIDWILTMVRLFSHTSADTRCWSRLEPKTVKTRG